MTDTRSTVPLDPASTALPRVRRLSDSERDVGALVASLLDGELERRAPVSFLSWVGNHLGVPGSDLTTRFQAVSGVALVNLAFAVGEGIERHAPTAVSSAAGEGSPITTPLDLPDRAVQLPVSVRVVFPAGTLGDVPVGICIEPGGSDGSYVSTTSLPGCEQRAYELVDQLVEDAFRDPRHPYRHSALQVDRGVLGDLHIEVAEVERTSREDLCLPDHVWDEIDESVHGILASRDLLRELGLGVNRGLLLTGPPGTGKTHLAKVVANEVRGTATVLFPSSEVVSRELAELYALAESLAPSLVVLEDVDLIIGNRGGVASSALVDFLVSVDGAMTRHEGVITLATTNDPAAIDAAAKREARLDRIIELPLPDLEGRRRIWQRYTARMPGEFDTDRLAAGSAGLSGAAIREVVRAAVLRTRRAPDMAGLLGVMAGRSEEPAVTGSYR